MKFDYYYHCFIHNKEICLLTNKGLVKYQFKPFYAEIVLDEESEFKTILGENLRIFEFDDLVVDETKIGSFNIITQFLVKNQFNCNVSNVDFSYVSISGRKNKKIFILNNTGLFSFDFKTQKKELFEFLKKMPIKILVDMKNQILELLKLFELEKFFLVVLFENLYSYFDNSLQSVNYYELYCKYYNKNKLQEFDLPNDPEQICYLMKKINDENLFLELLLQDCCNECCLLTDIFRPKTFWEKKIYNELYKEKILAPTKSKNEEYPISGGYFESISGIFKNIKIIDITSCFPSHIEQYNIGVETKKETLTACRNREQTRTCIETLSKLKSFDIVESDENEIKSITGFNFLRTQSFLVRIVEKLKKQRNQLQDS